MKNDEIRRANRKALPKFLLFAVACAAVGGVVGYCSGYGAAKGGAEKLAGMMKAAGAFFGAQIAPWLLLLLAVILPAVCIPIYRGAKKRLRAWDGEDEDAPEAIDRRLSAVLWLVSVTFIVSYFLIAASYAGGAAIFDDSERTVVFFIEIAAFFAIMIEAILFQQKCVDAAKRLYPEKKASVYDVRFPKKWMDDCDEAEKILIGKCAFKAYAATYKVCAALAAMFAVGALIFDTGFLPSLAVSLVWVVGISAYYREAMRYAKAGSKIS